MKRLLVSALFILIFFSGFRLAVYKYANPRPNYAWAEEKFRSFVGDPVPKDVSILSSKNLPGAGYNFSIEFYADEHTFRKLIQGYKEFRDCHSPEIFLDTQTSYARHNCYEDYDLKSFRNLSCFVKLGNKKQPGLHLMYRDNDSRKSYYCTRH